MPLRTLLFPRSVMHLTITLVALSLIAPSASGSEIRLNGKQATATVGASSFGFDLGCGGSLVSLRRGQREFVKSNGRNPPVLYVLEAFDGSKRITLSNRDAEGTSARVEARTLIIRNPCHRNLSIGVTARIEFDEAADESVWRIEVENRSQLGLLAVEYPCIFTANSLDDIADDRILAKGVLTNFPDPVRGYWNWGQTYWNLPHPQAALQLAAFYDPQSGLYFSSQDTEGYAKRNNIVRLVDQMKFSHTFYPEYAPGTNYRSPYPVVITTFAGEPTTWQHAADRYRSWAEKQWWCRTKWFDRPDVPSWLKQGAGVIVPRNYMTYAKEGENYYKYLWVEGQRYRQAIGEKNVIVLFHSWAEGKDRPTQLGHPKPGFHPPFKGVPLFREACSQIRSAGCFPFVFIAAPHLYVHTFGGGDYDNRDLYLREARRFEILAEKRFLKEAGEPKEVPTMVHMCPGTAYWRDSIRQACRQLVDWGVDVVQLDGFPLVERCYNPDHGHPLGGGNWYFQSWKKLIEEIQAECRQKNPRFVLTTEWPCEFYIPLVQLTMKRFGLNAWMVGEGQVPVYEYVYGDYDKSYGGEGDSTHIGPQSADPPGKPDAADYTSFGLARNLCFGLFPTIAFGLEKPSLDPATRNSHHLALYREQVAALGGYAQKYLLRGRMIHDPGFENPAATVRFWGWWLKPPRTDLYPHRAIIHSAWQAPDKDVAYFFVNITRQPQKIAVQIPALDGRTRVHIDQYTSGKKQRLATGVELPGAIPLELPPSEFVMLELTPGHADFKSLISNPCSLP